MKLVLISFLYISLHSVAVADSERVVDFQYDSAGNLVDISSEVNQNPPNVVTLTPEFINIGRTVSFTATGTDLANVTVSVLEAGLSINNVNGTKAAVSFDLTATDSASIGNATLNFTTGLGIHSESIIVAERLPNVTTEPHPISIHPLNEVIQVKLVFDEPRENEEIYDVSIADTSITTVAGSALTVPQGATEVTLDFTGLSVGITRLNVDLPSSFFFFSFPVFVGNPFFGDGETFSSAVGVTVGGDDPAGGVSNPVLSSAVGISVGGDDPTGGVSNPVLSSAVGVSVGGDDPTGGVSNPVLSSAVGVSVGGDDPTGGVSNPVLSSAVGISVGGDDPTGGVSNPVLSSAVGVSVGGDDPTGGVSNPVLSSPVGVSVGGDDPTGGVGNPILSLATGLIVGPLLENVQPMIINVDTSENVTITGYNLDTVDSVSVDPTDDLIINPFSVNPEGTEITFSIDADAAAQIGTRNIIVTTPSGVIDTLTGTSLEIEIQ